tara:strand:+ start:386 stop:988 length:603 start_codon:yes stop_codon:yes gene_type:complete
MNRKDALKNIAMLVGATFSAPTLMAMDRWQSNPSFSANYFILSKEDSEIIAEVSEMIIPETTTAGAKSAGVPAFITMMIQDCYHEPEQTSFKKGVEAIKEANFLKMNQGERTRFLKALEKQTKEDMKAYHVKQTKMGDNEDREQMKNLAVGLPFWRLAKELTLLGYYTSEKGILASFDYVPIPGKFELTKLTPNQKSFAY